MTITIQIFLFWISLHIYIISCELLNDSLDNYIYESKIITRIFKIDLNNRYYLMIWNIIKILVTIYCVCVTYFIYLSSMKCLDLLLIALI